VFLAQASTNERTNRGFQNASYLQRSQSFGAKSSHSNVSRSVNKNEATCTTTRYKIIHLRKKFFCASKRTLDLNVLPTV